MGMIASLFSVDEVRFQQIAAEPESFGYDDDANDSEGFNKTFQGLAYTLAKGRDGEVKTLVEQIFEPATFLGDSEDFDWAEVDWEKELQTPQHIFYHTPEGIKAIADFLATITDEALLLAFEPEEMNKAKVYPGEVWSRDNRPHIGYNEPDILEEFHKLKSFFARINNGSNYCLCFIS